jgi:transposase
MELQPPSVRIVRRRTRRDPKPRFLADVTAQLDAVMGCPQLCVAADHPARQIQTIVHQLDTSSLDAGYSSLGRHGHDPKRLLGVWLYASTIGIHYASQLERACKTDAALRLLSGGYSPSAATLKRFRGQHAVFFRAALEQTVRMAHEQGLLRTDEMAVDSMRLRAHASMNAVRRKQRALDRLAGLEKVNSQELSETEQATRDHAIARNRAVIATCEERDVTNYVKTNESAALMKFPHGGAQPGHRVTVTAAGASERIVIGVLVDAAPTDVGKLPDAANEALEVLRRAGVPLEQQHQLLADAGYWDTVSLEYAHQVRDRVQVWIADARPRSERARDANASIGIEDFVVSEDKRSVICPAGRPMQGPESGGKGMRRWFGNQCGECSLKPQCTKGKRRKFQINLAFEAARDPMRERLAAPGSEALYRKRSAIIEPVFASVESDMGFRRASSRHSETIVAEILLKLLAHNVRRLALGARKRFRVLWLTVDSDGRWGLLPD